MPEAAARLRQFIREVRRRWRRRVVLRALAQAAGLAAVPLLAVALLWRLFDVGATGVVLAVGAGIVLAIAGAALAARGVPAVPDERRVARYVEEAAAGAAAPLDDTVVSAVEALASPEPSPLTPSLVTQALRRLEDVDPARVVETSVLRRAAVGAVGAAALLVVAVGLFRAPFADAVQTTRLRLDPGAIALSVTPGDARVVLGDPITLRAAIDGPQGRALRRLSPVLVVTAGGAQREVPMAADGDGFAFAFESVDRTFDYRIRLGSAQSEAYTVSALSRPRVTRIDAHYEYPRFTALPPRDEEDAGDLYAPKGTRVRLTVHTDKPLAAGSLKLGTASEPQPMQVTGDTRLVADLELKTHDSYRLRLSDRDGLDADDGTEYFIRLVDDRPPDVRIARPGGDQKITPLEEVTIEARADDDYGIASFELVYRTPAGAEKVVPFERLEGSAVARIGSRQLHAEALGLQPGDVIGYYARARDVARGKAATTATSDMFFLEVRPFNEEFVLAQSQAMAGQGDPQVESLIDAQKQIIAATWNLERRGGAGRSAADIAALAAAQQELQTRAERLVRQSSGRSFEPFPQQIGLFQPRRRPAGAAAVAAAAAAMAKAAGELEAQRTQSAIPHEMAALQGLMQAQAEIRRRQVAQQQANGGGGGSGRQGQDLSALFDKELQRQQRTNYETRAQVETRPEAPAGDGALDRIRDLAKRQEELARRQRELAQASLAEAERRRQLEQLRREQARLQERAEQLEQQMQGRSGQQASASPGGQSPASGGQATPSGGRGGAAGGGGQASPLSRAREQMQRAADGLQRQSPGEAAASGSQAAEQLRQLERQLGGAQGSERNGATTAGELGLEAHQIAEAQRRVASEAGRLDAGAPAAAADALRRLAGEKERLADRVDALQQRADALASSGKGDETGRRPGRSADGADAAAAAAGAARQLRDQEVGEQMRAAAGRMRAAAGQGGAASPASGGAQAGEAATVSSDPVDPDAERRLAEALDGVARTLGNRDGSEASRLAAQLEESRALRDRLDTLERQIKEAESGGRDGRGGTAGRAGADGQRGDGQAGNGQGGTGQGGNGRPGADGLARLQRQYAETLQRARELGAASGGATGGRGGATPEEHQWSTSAPGNESFKQDFAAWDALRRDVDLALERYEAGLSARIVKSRAADRLSAGGSTRPPDAYDAAIARYYESLARPRK